MWRSGLSLFRWLTGDYARLWLYPRAQTGSNGEIRSSGVTSGLPVRTKPPARRTLRESATGTECSDCRCSRSPEPVPHVECTHGRLRRFKGRDFTATSAQPLRNIPLPHCSRVSQRKVTGSLSAMLHHSAGIVRIHSTDDHLAGINPKCRRT
jgi:hypothetical protein